MVLFKKKERGEKGVICRGESSTYGTRQETPGRRKSQVFSLPRPGNCVSFKRF
jgi:hypothetical protein